MKRRISILALPALALLASACASPGKPTQELSREQVCLAHFENDPVERDRCRQPAKTRSDTVPDVRPQDLPVSSGGLAG
jgi:hypothetical protein